MDETLEELLARKEYLETHTPEEAEASFYDVAHVFTDTDSVGVSLTHLEKILGINVCHVDKDDHEKSYVTPEGYALVAEIDKYINDEYTRWTKETMNSNNAILDFKREKICDRGLWAKKKDSDEEARKNYILHILDNEGVKHPKFKYTGVKFAKSTIPSVLKSAAKKIIEYLILSQDKNATDRLVQNHYDEFCKMDISDKAIIQRVKDMKKYERAKTFVVEKKDRKGNSYKGMLGDDYLLGTPGHVKAAIKYNRIIDKIGLKKLQKITSRRYDEDCIFATEYV